MNKVSNYFNWLRKAFQGKGGLDIAKGLNRDGIPSPGGKRWSKSTVNGIIGNEAITGTLVWGNRKKKLGCLS